MISSFRLVSVEPKNNELTKEQKNQIEQEQIEQTKKAITTFYLLNDGQNYTQSYSSPCNGGRPLSPVIPRPDSSKNNSDSYPPFGRGSW